ncbi:MAG: sugar transferase, partial [Acidobacteria bacterium]
MHAPTWTSFERRDAGYVDRRPRRRELAWYEPMKRALDLAASLAVLPLVLPVIAACALVILIESPGAPALFRQERTGRGGRRFRMYKLRTMVPNAHELKARYMHLNEHRYPDFKITNDPRVTRCGRILRKTSLDELPQI